MGKGVGAMARRKYFFQPADLTPEDLERARFFVHVDPYDGHPVLHMQLPPEPRYPRVPRWFSFFLSEKGLTWCKYQGVEDEIEYDGYEVREISREEADRVADQVRERVGELVHVVA